jgi:hypothetical protein
MSRPFTVNKPIVETHSTLNKFGLLEVERMTVNECNEIQALVIDSDKANNKNNIGPDIIMNILVLRRSAIGLSSTQALY